MGVAEGSNDIIIRRLQHELQEKSTFAQGILERANAASRDLTVDERGLLTETRGRMEELQGQVEDVQTTFKVAYESRNRSAEIGREIEILKGRKPEGDVEYRSSGAYIVDAYKSHMGDREATGRIDMFERAAAHQKTSDNPGIVPDPVVGELINYVDAQRPLVLALGPRPIPGATWSRPRVTQHTSVGKQGAAGLAADQKTELVSQKMVIGKLTAEVVTYGGYVNVSRQNIDFSNPQAFDIIVNDLADQYAIETEAAVADALTATGTTAVGIDLSPATGTRQEAIATGLFAAAGKVWRAVKGRGRIYLAMSPELLEVWGPVFAGSINPQSAIGTGIGAGQFGQGVVGTASGVTAVVSAGLDAAESFLFSTAAIEVYEQRIGTLQVVEPSVLGVQVAYAGYFTPMTIEEDAIVPITFS
jgi:HK97 family phage major capsid protein